MKQPKNTSKIISILIGFVLLSGTLAVAIGPTQAFAGFLRLPSEPPAAGPFTGLFDIGETLFDDGKTNVYCRAFELPLDNNQVAILGTPTQSFPTSGNDYVVLSTGFANNIPGVAAQLASNFMGGLDGFGYPAQLLEPVWGTSTNDSATLGISCDLPANASTLTFDWTFGTEENPAFLPFFPDGVFTDSADYGNVLILPNGLPATANHAAPISNNPGATDPSPDDTKMNAVACSNTGACSLPITTVIDVSGEAGSTISLQFRILDDQDIVLDSALWLDNFVLEVDNKVCSAGDVVCKQAGIVDEDGDGIIEIGELITYTFHITVSNNSGQDWSSVVVKDNFAGNLLVNQAPILNEGGALTFKLKGNTEKAQMSWAVGELADGESKQLVLAVETDTTPGGDQSYTECSLHELNSGANVKFRNEAGKQRSFVTPELIVSVLTVDAAGDCDGDFVFDNVDACPHQGFEVTGLVDPDGCPIPNEI